MEEGPIRDSFVEVIGMYMKMAYKTWNKEHYVSDDVIIDDLKTLSNGKLELHENAELDNLAHANRRRQQQQQQHRNENRDRDNYHRNRQGGGGRDRDRDRGGRDRDRGGRRNRKRK
jgi:hypothetical protein